MVPYDFLELLQHLVCHAPWSAPALNWLLSPSQNHIPGGRPSRGEDQQGPPAATHTLPNSTPTRGGEKTNRCVCAQGCWPIVPNSLGAAVTPATDKIIHKTGPAHIQSHQPYTAATVTCHHSPKRDEKNKCTQVHVHGRRGDRPQLGALADRVTCPRCGEGQMHLAQALLSAPPDAWAWLTQSLEPILISKLWSPRSTNVTFREQQKKKKKGHCYGL
jgi:hypothetical protein